MKTLKLLLRRVLRFIGAYDPNVVAGPAAVRQPIGFRLRRASRRRKK